MKIYINFLDINFHQTDGKSRKMADFGRGSTTPLAESSMCQNLQQMCLCTSSYRSVPRTSDEGAPTPSTSESETNGDFQMQIGRCTMSRLELRPSSSTLSSSPTTTAATALEPHFLTMNDVLMTKDILEEDIFPKQNKNHLEQDLQARTLATPHREETSEDLTHFLLNKVNKINMQSPSAP